VLHPGFKYNMTDLQAALGLHQIRRLAAYAAVRKRIWEQYDAAFADLPVETPAPEEPGTRHARHLYTILLDLDRVRATRDAIVEQLKREGIGTGIHFVALHLHPYYRDRFGFAPEAFPNAREISRRTISLPLSASLQDEDVADVIAAVRKVLLRNA
jgi:dTDP-4-amino-4,6-dideoxygalactose transaminase